MAAICCRHGVGVIDQQVGAGFQHRTGAFVGTHGFGETAHRLVRTRQHRPALVILRLVFELGGKPGHHLLDLLLRELLSAVRRLGRRGIQGGRVAEHEVEQDRTEWQDESQHDRNGTAGRDRGGFRAAGCLAVFQQATLQLGPGLVIVGLREDAFGTVAVQFGELVAIDGGIQLLTRNVGARRTTSERPEQEEQRNDDKNGGTESKAGHDYWPSLSSASARFLSASLSGFSSTCWLRRRR
jgi:hypothetical protein